MLEVRELSKAFGGLRAVDQASLDVRAGEIVGLIGPNGAGKTTLFATIAGFHKPDTGRITLQGHDITGLAPHRICAAGMVRTFQITQPFARISVRENIMVGAYFRTADRHEAANLAEAVATQVGMGNQLDRPGSDLTVAGRKRLELARALATRPKLLLLDEIAGGLTEHEAAELVGELKRIKAAGVTMIWIEHVVHALLAIADRLFVINFGCKLAEGEPRAVMANADVQRVYMGMEA